MIVSFALTAGAVKAGLKTVTRRLWKPSHRAKFHQGKIVDAWDALPFAGGQKFATLELTADPVLQPLSAITLEDVAAEGFPHLSVDEFIGSVWQEQIGGSPDDVVTVVRFRLRSVIILGKLVGGEGRRLEAFGLPDLTDGGQPFEIAHGAGRLPVRCVGLKEVHGNPFYTLAGMKGMEIL